MSGDIQDLRRALGTLKHLGLNTPPTKFALAWAGDGRRFGVQIAGDHAVELADVEGIEPYDRVPLRYRPIVDAELARVAPNARMQWGASSLD